MEIPAPAYETSGVYEAIQIDTDESMIHIAGGSQGPCFKGSLRFVASPWALVLPTVGALVLATKFACAEE